MIKRLFSWFLPRPQRVTPAPPVEETRYCKARGPWKDGQCELPDDHRGDHYCDEAYPGDPRASETWPVRP